jgi:hypothetical protein
MADSPCGFRCRARTTARRRVPRAILQGQSAATLNPGTAAFRFGVPVADGQWHAVECARVGGLLTLTVDGTVRGSVALPTTLSVSNTQPLSIGGKGTSPNNDQFAGSLDDVYVDISR